jgi:6-phosphogluconate dehydrogenase
MDIGFIGLGKMGLNMDTRIQRAGHRVTAYDRSADELAQAAAVGCVSASSLADLVQRLKAPRVVWIMVPMIADAIEKAVSVPTLAAALFTRFRSRHAESFVEKCWRPCGMHLAATL